MKQDRRVSALARLKAQLESGVKTKKGTVDEKTPLTDKDKARISKEITKLEQKTK